MVKVLFIDPYGWQGYLSGNVAYPNVGIAYLISHLKKCGHRIKILDMNNQLCNHAGILSVLKEFKPSLIGISVKTATIDYAKEIAEFAKKSYPHIPIILGGAHVAIERENLIKERSFDAIFLGEGESSLSELCDYYHKNQKLPQLDCLITRDSGNHMPYQMSINIELDSLEFPDYEDFPDCVKKNIVNRYPIVTSRGCPYKCTYCSVGIVSGKRWRKRIPENVIEELQFAKKRWRITGFEIIDDVFNLDINRAKEICKLLIGSGLNLNWTCPNGIRADQMDDELARLMFRAGCQKVYVGVESGDPEVFNRIKKGENLESVKKGINILQKTGIHVDGYFIIGLPGDCLESTKRSLKFIKENKIGAHFNFLMAYPGTELYQWVLKEGRFLEPREGSFHFTNVSEDLKVTFETDEFPAKDKIFAWQMAQFVTGNFSFLYSEHFSFFEKTFKLFEFGCQFGFFPIASFLMKQVHVF